MRSLNDLALEYPNKTGAELLSIQESDKLADQQLYEEKHKAQLAVIEKYNADGAYFKSVSDEIYRYDHFFNFEVEGLDIFCDAETVIGNSNILRVKILQGTTLLLNRFNTDNPITKEEYELARKKVKDFFDDFWLFE